jgi:hypothetical protein
VQTTVAKGTVLFRLTVHHLCRSLIRSRARVRPAIGGATPGVRAGAAGGGLRRAIPLPRSGAACRRRRGGGVLMLTQPTQPSTGKRQAAGIQPAEVWMVTISAPVRHRFPGATGGRHFMGWLRRCASGPVSNCSRPGVAGLLALQQLGQVSRLRSNAARKSTGALERLSAPSNQTPEGAHKTYCCQSW